jgi:hypothetical protein
MMQVNSSSQNNLSNETKIKTKNDKMTSNNNNNSNQFINSSQSTLSSSNKKNNNNNNNLDIKVQVYYSGLITVIYIKESMLTNDTNDTFGILLPVRIDISHFRQQIKNICKFDSNQPFTLKWVDEEGDPCTITNQWELDEAIRLYYLNKETELIIHAFGNVPVEPGFQCVGEDRSIYRRGARRWRKIYLVNGHKYQAKR